MEISVNLSRTHLKQKGLCICDDYYRIKSRYHIPEGVIKLEITENSMFELDDTAVSAPCRSSRKAVMKHRSVTIQKKYEAIPTGNWPASMLMTEKVRPVRKNARISKQ